MDIKEDHCYGPILKGLLQKCDSADNKEKMQNIIISIRTSRQF